MNTKAAVSHGLPDADPQTPVLRHESCSGPMARRVAAMLDLDLDEAVVRGVLPLGWHFPLLAADTRRSALRADGFPGLGVPMPDFGLPRLMLGGRTVAFVRDIAIGAALERRSAITSIQHKNNSAGPMALVGIEHRLTVVGQDDASLIETQTYVLLPARAPSAAPAPSPKAASPSATHYKTIVPDETLLFQYSALGFNSHKIHIDREHARNVEGFPELVVNGGLCTLLLTEFLRQDLKVRPATLAVRHLAPLLCNRPTTFTADPTPQGWHLKAFDDTNNVAVDMKVEVQ